MIKEEKEESSSGSASSGSEYSDESGEAEINDLDKIASQVMDHEEFDPTAMDDQQE